MGVVVPLPLGHHATDNYIGHHLNDFQSTVANGVTVKESMAKICQIFERNGIFSLKLHLYRIFLVQIGNRGPKIDPNWTKD